jgi:phosphonoacetaldehyde hydrolase
MNPVPPAVTTDRPGSRSVRAILLDWAGTTIDHGSLAPTSVFIEIFRAAGIDITAAEARGPMGTAKRDHIAAVLAIPRVSAAWEQRHGKPAYDTDVESLYREFLPLQKSVLAAHCDLIPGVLELVDCCRQRGIRIGSTTGYTRELMDVVEPLAAEAGYSPEVVICSDEVSAGRPAPWSNFHAAEKLGVFPASEILVVDDTVAGIRAGRNAGMLTVGVTRTGNAIGLSAADVAALPAPDLALRLAAAEAEFLAAGADFCLGGVDELPAWLASNLPD